HATAEDQRAEEKQPTDAQPLRPEGQIRHRPGQYTLVLTICIEQPPVAADSPLAGALPGLVEGFNQVVVPAIVLSQGDKTTNEPGFVDPAWQRRFALAAFAWPAGFANHHVFGGEAIAKYLADLRDLIEGGVDVGR